MCPDCGSPAGSQPFCASCGRNLSMIERLPTRAEWRRDGAPATNPPASFPTKVAEALASIRTWYVPLDRSPSFHDPGIRDRVKLSVHDHVGDAIRRDNHKEAPIDITISVKDKKTAYLAVSVSVPAQRALEQQFVASIERARKQAQVHRIGHINLVGPDGDVIQSFAGQGSIAKSQRPKASGSGRAVGCLTFIALIVIVVVVISSLPGGKSETPQQKAQAYIKSMGRDINTVQVSVESVQAGILIFQKSGASADALNQFAQLAQQAHDSIDAVRQDFATGDISGNLGNAEVELFTAANDLKNAMGAVVAYTGNPNPATLAHFKSQYQTAVGEWDDGIKSVWSIAGERKPPTV